MSQSQKSLYQAPLKYNEKIVFEPEHKNEKFQTERPKIPNCRKIQDWLSPIIEDSPNGIFPLGSGK